MTSRLPQTSKTSPATTAHAATAKPTTRFVVASWLAVVVVAGLIFFLSAHTGDELDTSSGIITLIRDWLEQGALLLFGKPVDISPVGHFCEYFLLGVVLTNALRLHVPYRRAGVFALLVASAYGITDELHQLFVPQRSCDPLDWVVDTLAAGIACLIACAIIAHRAKEHRSGANHTQPKRDSNL